MGPKHLICSAVVLALALPNAGSRSRVTLPPESPDLSRLRGKANTLYRSRQYLEASRIYETGYEQARARGEPRTALRFLNNLGSSQNRLYRLRAAIRAY